MNIRLLVGASICVGIHALQADIPISSIRNNSSTMVTFARPIDKNKDAKHLVFVKSKTELVPAARESSWWRIAEITTPNTLIITRAGIFMLEYEDGYVYIRQLKDVDTAPAGEEHWGPRKKRLKVTDRDLVRVVINKNGTVSLHRASEK